MKTKHLLFAAVLILFTALQTIAQDAINGTLAQKTAIPFGKKLPPPDLSKLPGYSLPVNARAGMKNSLLQNIKNSSISNGKPNIESFKQTIMQMRNNRTQTIKNSRMSSAVSASTNSDFHLTKDINSLAESYPSNYSAILSDLGEQINHPYAVLNSVIYFGADDGVHGNELWRSDGTEAGTYMLKDIEPGASSSSPYDITAVNGKIYFNASTEAYGAEPWVSDGTESGTQLLKDIGSGNIGSNPAEFTAVGNKIYFVTDDNDFLNELWQTDGTTANTTLVQNITGSFFLSQLTAANGLLFFTLINEQSFTYELWRSDGTDGGTYHVGTNVTFFNNFPAQLTSYNHLLYFSADDGTGNKLWTSDGTDAGTGYARNNNNVIIYSNNLQTHFPVLNNVLYMAAVLNTDTVLYKYDAANSNGLILVKDIASNSGTDAIVPTEMRVVHNTLFFKVQNNNGTQHDELWSSEGDGASTNIVYAFKPGETTYSLWDGGGRLYFIENNKNFGTELWTLVETPFGSYPIIVKDIFKGSTSSYPNFLTNFKGQLFFSATDDKKGNELFSTNYLDIIYGANIVKDINTVSTSGSGAGDYNGYGYQYGNMAAIRNEVVFDAYENKYGNELYKSDGTQQGTHVLNDITPGESGSNPYGFFPANNNNVYFIAYSSDATRSIYKSDGTKAGLQKLTPNLSYNFYIQDYAAADNGLLYYVIYDYSVNAYELWRGDGTAAGTYMLSSTVYYADGLHVAGNTAFFVAGDADHGYELWKSDGTTSGTAMVKDINLGVGDGSIGGLFVYKNEVYFAAYDGAVHEFWKSDGTEAGTIKLKNIDIWYGSVAVSTDRYFCISNGILYFSALRYSDGKGTELWKTDGTYDGTKAVRDINPNDNSVTPGPYYLTDVNGTVFFRADDGVHGNELWKTDGTYNGTQLVKDITPGLGSTYLSNLVSYAGKLYFSANDSLWVSDGTENGTMQINDGVINQIEVFNVVAAGDNLFIAGGNYKYGLELYSAHINEAGKFAAAKVENLSTPNTLNILLYPNPVSDVLNINPGSLEAGKINIQVTDMSGKTVINKMVESPVKTNMQLNVSQLAAGTYFVKLINADGSAQAVKKFIKQ